MYFSHGTDLWNKTEQCDSSVPQRWLRSLNPWRGTGGRSGRRDADFSARCKLSGHYLTFAAVEMWAFLFLGDVRGGYLIPAGHPRSPPGHPGTRDLVDIIWLRSAIVTIMQSFDQVMPPKCRQFQRKTVNNICYARFYQYVIELTSFCNQIPENSVSSNLPWRLHITFPHTYLSITISHSSISITIRHG